MDRQNIHSIPFLLAAVALFCDVTSATLDVINVTAPAGKIGGIRETISLPDSSDAIVTSFRGIPYAQSPVGELRFQKPVAKPVPQEYLLADKESVACAQNPDMLKDWVAGPSDMSEDCLKLNVYVPQDSKSAHQASESGAQGSGSASQGSGSGESKLPVMVWFYGGGAAFLIGHTRIYDGRRLAGLGGVVVVTVNYRLGPLGFLSTEDSVAPGNMGLWDQHAALRWVHDNIAAFGGDPDLVTVFGESAGAASVIYQLLYPGNKGLIHRAVAESGSPLCPWAFQPGSGRAYAEWLAGRLGCHVVGSGTARSQSVVDCLRSKPFADIVTNSSVGSLAETLFRGVWIPTVDGEFLTASPADILTMPVGPDSSGVLDLFRDVDLLIGANEDDGEVIAKATVQAFFEFRTGLTFKDDNLTSDVVRETYLPQVIKDRFGISSPAAEDILKLVYADHVKATERKRALQEVLDVTSDYEFIMPALITADNHARVSSSLGSCGIASPEPSECDDLGAERNAPKATYVYVFGYQYPYVERPDWLEGAAHGDELPFVFGLPDSMKEAFNLTAARVQQLWPFAKTIMTYWTNFAKTGDPTKPVSVPVPWPRYSTRSKQIITLKPDMTSDTALTSDPFPQRSRLWKESLPGIVAMEMNQCYREPVDVSSGQPVVTVNNTAIFGQQTRVAGRPLWTFLGIPFAAPPVGDLRFKKPEPLTSLPSVLNATSYKAACLSVYPGDGQNEDCLYLNVFVPASASPTHASSRPLPVMVWIHGGGFVTGSAADNDGSLLAAENDVIVVTLDYRLGAFGFLSTQDEAAPGNAGLWDQHAALSWVKVNIGSFGGDPDAITVFGESAGGKSVSFLATSPYSGPLIQRAIMQSGTIYCPTALHWKPVNTAVRLGKALDCDVSSHQVMVDCLRHKPAVRLAFLSGKLWDEDPVRKLIDFGWSPVEDGDFVPVLYNQDGSLAHVHHFRGSVMLGINNNEGALLKMWRIPEASRLDPAIEEELHDRQFFTNDFLHEVLAQMFKTLPDDSPSFRAAAEAVSYVYRDWASPESNLTDMELYGAFGEQAYMAPAFQYLTQLLRSKSESPSLPEQRAYLYVFDHYPLGGEQNFLGGMKHGDDVAYTFGEVEDKFREMGVPDDVVTRETILGRHFRTLLTNFAKTGNPLRPHRINGWPDWPTYNLRDQAYLAVSPFPRVEAAFRADMMALWGDLVPRLVAQGGGHDPRMTERHSDSSSTCSGDSVSSGAVIVSVNGALVVWLIVWLVWGGTSTSKLGLHLAECGCDDGGALRGTVLSSNRQSA